MPIWSSVRGRAILAGVVFMLLLAAVATVAVWRARDDLQRHDSLERTSLDVTSLERAQSRFFEGLAIAATLVWAQDPALGDIYSQDVVEIEQGLSVARAEALAQGDAERAAALDNLIERTGHVTEEIERNIAAVVEASPEEATQIALARMAELTPEAYAIRADLNRLVQEGQDELAAKRAAADSAAGVTMALLIAFGAAALVTGIGALVLLLVSVVRPLASLRASVRAITSGDVEARVRVSGPEEISSLARDFNEMVTERRWAEDRVEHLNSVLRAIADVNQLLVKERDRRRLLKGVCDSLIGTRGYHNAWAALVDESGGLITSAEAGLGKDFLPVIEGLKRGELPACSRRALAQAGPIAIEDPPTTCRDCPLAAKYGGRGAMTVRLEYSGSVYGLLAVSVPAEFIADEEERSLLKEVAGDIGFALYSMQVEDERKRAEEALHQSESKYRQIFENVQDIFYRTDAKGIITEISPSVERYGYTREGLIGTQVLDIYENPEERSALLKAVLEQGEVGDYEVRLKTGDGRVAHASVSAHGDRGADGKIVGVEGALRDITERKRMEEALRESEAKYRDLVETLAAAAFIFQGTKMHYVNPAAEAMTGYTREELLRMNFWDVIHRGFRELVKERGEARQRGEPVPLSYEVKILTKSGEERWVDFTAAAIEFEGEPAVLGTAFNITERKRAEEALREQASHDPLTGALNHGAIVGELRGLLSGSDEGSLHALAMVDVDGLKAINDTYGHQVGDAVLVAVANALSKDGATVGRYGGDEFVVILPGADRDAAQRYRDAVLDSLAYAGLTVPETGANVPVVVSIGLVVYPTEAARVEEMIKLADSEMYAVKRQRPVGSTGRTLPQPLGSERAAKTVGELVPLLTSPGDVDEKLRLAAHRLSIGAGCDVVHFSMFPLEPGGATVSESFGRLSAELVEAWDENVRSTWELPHPLRLLVERTRRPVILEDLRTDDRIPARQRELLSAAGVRSGLVVPLLLQDTAVGLLAVGSTRKAAFGPNEAQFFMAVASQVAGIARMATLVEELKSASDRLAEARTETVILLAAAAEARDHTTGIHLQNVRATSEVLARELGYDDEDARELGVAAVLHDIGKIRVPDSVLASEGQLAEEEWELMKRHTVWGEEFLKDRPGFELAATIARSHHEHWDGSGYPDGLADDRIPESAAIVAVADAFDAITSDRPYRPRRSRAAALREITACSGKQFSPKAVRALGRLYRRKTLPVTVAESPDQRIAA